MSLPEDMFNQQRFEFQKKLRAMAHHQTQAIAIICAERIRHALDTKDKPSPWHHRFSSAWQRFKQGVAIFHPLNSEMPEMPNEDGVIVIDAEYTVVSFDSPPGSNN